MGSYISVAPREGIFVKMHPYFVCSFDDLRSYCKILSGEIGLSQNYSALQTRRAEIVEQRILELERDKAQEKLSQTE